MDETKRKEAPQEEEAVSGDFSPEERRRLTRCRRLAAGLPLLTATLSALSWAGLSAVGLVQPERKRPIDGLRELGGWLAMALWPLSAAAAGALVIRMHPVARRRWAKALGWSGLGAVSYAVAYVALIYASFKLLNWWNWLE